MKLFEKHKRLLTVIAVAAVYVSVLLLAPMLVKIPGAISYTAATQNGVSDSDANHGNVDPVYTSFKDIKENGPFRICAVGDDGVYVFSGDKCLYRIKITMSQFTTKDAESVLTGIEISDKSVLSELIEYIES